MLLAKGVALEHENKVGQLGLRDSLRPSRHGVAVLRGSLPGTKHTEHMHGAMACRTAGQLSTMQHGIAPRRWWRCCWPRAPTWSTITRWAGWD